MSSRGATAQGDGGFCDTSYKRELEQDSTAGWRGCQKTPGCCFAHATQQCRACQVRMCIDCLHVQRSLSERARRRRESESETTRERERETLESERDLLQASRVVVAMLADDKRDVVRPPRHLRI